ncbi:hypothetical protein DH2020_015354 [Rehmannia glutinosa]|uniref:Oxidation resistance protein 1 n=1 Tax=Rehmannia glutinosa TaxID=99300 RepID=A0ABR0WSE0_REHGL
MGREHEQEEKQQSKSLRSKAAHFVSDITTVLLNPISDKPSTPPPQPSSHDDLINSDNSRSDAEEDSKDSVDGPDTSSFTAFLYSLLASSEPQSNSNLDKKVDTHEDEFKQSSEPIITKENAKKKSLFSRGKHSLGKAFYQAAKIGGFRNQAPKGSSDMVVGNGSNSKASGDEGICMQTLNESLLTENLPETSEPSLLLSEKTRSVLYAALPYLEAWYIPFNIIQKKYDLAWPQSTGMNRYFTLCSTEYLAMGGGGHFALYLDGDLLSGSSSSSETYGNPCLARSEDFEVKEVELWGFVYASKYEEIIALSRTEVPGICRCDACSSCYVVIYVYFVDVASIPMVDSRTV